MMKISAENKDYKELNSLVRSSVQDEITIEGCLGQRYIGAGSKGKAIEIHGTPGNALAAYLDGSSVCVYGNGQDAVGDTMNDGRVIIHGSAGDACGYAMRGGKIFIRDNTGYRTGIHMKEYNNKKPAIVIGGEAGSFLSEYQAGGIVIVLGLKTNGRPPVGRFCSAGMHGGKVFIRGDEQPEDLPPQVFSRRVQQSDLEEIMPLLEEYCEIFGIDLKRVLDKSFYMIYPDSKNPYRQLYTAN